MHALEDDMHPFSLQYLFPNHREYHLFILAIQRAAGIMAIVKR